MSASFRGFLQTLREHNELIEISKPIDLSNIAALVPQAEKALLFTHVKGYTMPVVSGLLQSRNRMSLGMGVPYGGIEKKFVRLWTIPLNPSSPRRLRSKRKK
ncbi:MAG: UbiD family decarboxylase [Deltaproteobacteria bacterium]|nr:UbiD family decarboxylase [Deltaproteobacteria bacterium]